MTTPYPGYPPPGSYAHIPTAAPPATPTPRGRGRGAVAVGAKRGRKPRGALPNTAESQRQPTQGSPPAPSSPFTPVQWSQASQSPVPQNTNNVVELTIPPQDNASAAGGANQQQQPQGMTDGGGEQNHDTGPTDMPVVAVAAPGTQPQRPSGQGGDEDQEGEDELLPAMADDDYSAQLSWQSQSKDNLKVLMDNFSPAQYDRFEAYRRHALPKQAVRRVIQQTIGQQVSQPVAQIVAGFAKVFVGEIVEKARAVQARRSETGPLSPDHLREAYRMYQQETGRVGSARPMRSKRIFVR